MKRVHINLPKLTTIDIISIKNCKYYWQNFKFWEVKGDKAVREPLNLYLNLMAKTSSYSFGVAIIGEPAK
jgi:hypothetical protein